VRQEGIARIYRAAAEDRNKRALTVRTGVR
jgi:hypothetical protein